MTHSALLNAVQLQQLLDSESVIALDGRDAKAFEQGHVPGAVNLREMLTDLPLSSDAAGVRALRERFSQLFGLAGLSGAEHAVVYEESQDGAFGSSCRGYFLLKYLGYDRVYILHGGFSAWRAGGHDITNAQMLRAPQVFPAQEPDGRWLATRDDVLAATRDDHGVIVDARDEAEWQGQASSPIGVDYCPRKGRIPGARWFPWRRLFTRNEGIAYFKEPARIAGDCADLGIGARTPVIVYCFSGVRASSVLVGMQAAGIENVRVYLAGWNEWSRDPTLPVEAELPSAR